MTAPDLSVTRLGQVNGANSATALFLQVFGGEVLAAFDETCVMADKHMMRTIQHGKAASFPAIGKTVAAYHSPGTMLVGDAVNQNERVISIDGMLLASSTVASIDDLMNHWDTRSEIGRQLAQALANKMDKQLLQLCVLAARASATVTGLSGGSALTYANSLTTGADLAQAIFGAAQKLDEKDVPENDRYAVVRPEQYNLLVQTTNVINRDWGGSGTYADGKVLKVAGVSIIKSNHLPRTNISADSPAPVNTYHGDFSTTSAVVFQRGAVGTVKLADLQTSVDWIPQNEAWLLKAKIPCGHGILRPECAVEIKTG